MQGKEVVLLDQPVTIILALFLFLKYTKTNLYGEIYCGYVVKTGKTTAAV